MVDEVMLIGHNDGWSVYFSSNMHYFYIWNSDSHEKIMMPEIKKEDIPNFSKCLVIYPIVMLVYHSFKSAMVYDCETTDEHQWNKLSLLEDGRTDDESVRYEIFSDVIAFDGKFYGIDRVGDILEIVICEDEHRAISIELVIVSFVAPNVLFEKVQFVISCDQLFLVTMLTNLKLEVFRLEFSSSKFIPIYNLRDRVFFLSNHFFGSFEHLTRGNCIYFTRHEVDNETLYLFDYEDDTLSAYNINNNDNGGCLSFSYNGLLLVLSLTGTTITCTHLNNVIVKNNVVVKSSSSKRHEISTEEPIVGESLIMSTLPLHVQEHIAKFVTKGQDYLNFRSVCMTWRSITPTRQWQASSSPKLNIGFEYPWLVTIKRETCKLSDPKDNIAYLMNDPQLSNCVIRASKDGWILVTKGRRKLFLYEPFMKKKINLPSLKKTYCFNGICWSDTPTASTLTIFGFYQTRDEGIELKCLYIGNELWLKVFIPHEKPFTPCYCNPVFFNGWFYILSQQGSIGAFNAAHDQLVWEVISAPSPLISLYPTTKVVSNYLILYNQELFSVHVSNVAAGWVKVFKLKYDLSGGRGDGDSEGEWDQVSSLENSALFVSEIASFALVVHEERMRNNIYLPCLSTVNGIHNHVYYSLESRKYCTYYCGADGGDICNLTPYDTKEQLNSTWLQPRLVPSSW